MFFCLTVLAAGCTAATDAAPPLSTGPRSPATTAAVPTAPIVVPKTSAALPIETTSNAPALAAPVFRGSVEVLPAAIVARMTPTSWREGCPVPLESLRYVRVSHWDSTGGVADGELVVHVDHASNLVAVFDALFAARFPIEQMRLVDDFQGDDQMSMRANNTSAFNCREVAYTPGRWSNHAFGAAIDINPLKNPYVAENFVDPPQAAEFADRSRTDVPGYITADGAVVAAFADIGWGWGGTWSSAKDYQHFSADGG